MHCSENFIVHCPLKKMKTEMRGEDFIIRLFAEARKNPARILLPESRHPQVLAAAAKAHANGAARCVLLGEENEIRQAAAEHAVVLPDSMEIMRPPVEELIAPLAKLRANKGMNEKQAEARLRDDIVAVAAMMTRQNIADGVVAGAMTTSASVLRAFLQIIGKKKNAPLASSFFVMPMQTRTMLFADCALNPNPTASELAAIAAQTAASARQFGIAPVVAMLSYATGDSASGSEVEKIKEAATLAQKQIANAEVIGPIQYDAAVSEKIGASKAPQWPSAGRANTLIFPNLSAGNIAYKAAQHAANIAAVGPLMQGLSSAANDLSRGATAEDIACVIAATSLQAAAD